MKEKSLVAERFIRTLRNKMHKYMTLISKNMPINKVDDIVNKYNNTYQNKSNKAYQNKASDVKSSTYIDFDRKNN